MLPKTSAFVKSYDGQTKWIYFLIEGYDLLEKYDTIWDKVSADIKKEFDIKPVYNNFFWTTKQVTDFSDKKFQRWALMKLV